MKLNHTIIRAVCLLLVLLMTTSVLAQSGLITSTTTEIWLRSGPGTEWYKLKVLSVGTTIALDGHDPTGQWIRGISSGGDVGWLASRYVAASAEEIFTLPSIWVDEPFTLAAPAQGATASVPAQTETTTENTAPAEAAAPVAAAEVTGGSLEVRTTSTLNLRGGPSTSYQIVTTLNGGAVLRLDGQDASGQWARGVDATGKIGWAYAAYLSSGISGLPVVTVDTPFGTTAPASAEAAAAPAETTVLPAAVVNSAAPVTGFNLGGQVSIFSGSTENWMRVAGMTWVKRQVRYNQGANPDEVSGLINDAHGRGFNILLSVIGNHEQLNNGGYFEQYADYVGGLAALGANAIEVWNEQNIDREWPAGSIDPGRYTQLLALSYNAIKSRNAGTMVISGAPAPTGFFGGCGANGCDDAPFIAGMAAAGAANYMDCLGIHYNEGIVPPTQTSGDPRSEHYTRYFWGMTNTYYNAMGGAKPLCFTEMGYLTPEGYGQLPGGFAWAQNTTVAQQASWLDQAVSLAANSGKARMVIVWNVDFTQFGSDPQGAYAIIRPNGDCPACTALGN